MQIPHILLADGTLVISLDSTVTLSPRSLNYPRIIKAIQANDRPLLLSLLREVPTDGIWYAYSSNNTLKLYHIAETYESTVTTMDGTNTRLDKDDIFLGAYPSRDVLIVSHPEYFI